MLSKARQPPAQQRFCVQAGCDKYGAFVFVVVENIRNCRHLGYFWFVFLFVYLSVLFIFMKLCDYLQSFFVVVLQKTKGMKALEIYT